MSTEQAAHNWVRVTRESPCPVCGKPDNCEVSRDGVMVWCGRVAEGSLKENAGGQYLHRLRESLDSTARPEPSKKLPAPGRDYSALAERLYQEGSAARQTLAIKLGVQVSALDRLRVGWNKWEQYWSFPERNAAGRIIGISGRSLEGSKQRLPGGKAGLTYVADWDSGDGPICLVEGGSDTAALLSLEINAIGRPSNRAGIALLTEMLARLPASRQIIVIGERDQKEDGAWPGKDGAVHTAERLCDALERPIAWSLPPDRGKDAREWLQTKSHIPAHRLAPLFLSGLETTVVAPPPHLTLERNQPRPRLLTTWREAMLQVREDVMNTPGCYLDASPTGAGKSHVDFTILQRIFSGEAA